MNYLVHIFFQQCHPLAVKTHYTVVFSIFNLCMSSLVPFCVLLILNSFIIVTLQKRKDTFNKIGTSRDSSSEQKSSDFQVTVMLLLVSFTLLILTLPQYIRITIYTFLDNYRDPTKMGTYKLITSITYKFFAINNVCNFFLYAISGSKFRGDLA